MEVSLMAWYTNSRKRQLFFLFGILILLATVGVIAADQAILHDTRILPNVHIAYIDVGGLTREEAEAKLDKATRAAAGIPVMLTDQVAVWFVSPEKIDFSIDVKKSVLDSLAYGRDSGFFQRWKDRLSAREHQQYLPVHISCDKTKLEQVLTELAPVTDRQPRDAALLVLVKSKNIGLIPAIEGRKLDIQRTAAEAFGQPQMQLASVIDLKFNLQTPKLTDASFVGINTMLAQYSTHFKPWDYDRNANLQLATQRIHGTVLKPGEVFSYNNIVGNRTQQQGFRMAPVILDGKLVPDWGGGVCQVSSTLYNSALLANLEIVDRSNHGRAIGYVPLGFDATVVDGYIDFKFKNNLSRPIMLHATITDNELFFAILGDVKDTPPPIELDYVVHRVIEPVEIKQPDPTLELGKEVVEESPQRGFRVSTYRIRTVNGKEERQLLATDDYDPVNRIIKIGSKPNDAKTPTVVDPNKKTAPGSPPLIVQGTITLQGQPSKPQR
jgi:vancomycin resistance protein YoaR